MLKKLIFISFIVLTVLFSVYAYIQPKPPSDQLADARRQILLAKDNNAIRYKHDEYNKATLYYDSAMDSWATENDKFIFFRDYTMSQYYADQANYWANASSHNIKEMENDHIANMTNMIDATKFKIESFRRIYGKLPIQKKEAHQLARARMLYKEANVAFENQNWSAVDEKLKASQKLIDKLSESANQMLSHYFQSFPLWERQTKNEIKNSENNNKELVIIDKYARKCYFYQKGKLIRSYEVELGTNWIGDKLQAGDKTTPEGTYLLTKKKENGATHYHKAFLLNYPNDEDKARFTRNKANGIIPSNTSIGNLIEIHGHGGKGHDWTDGCVALKDADMDQLFKACEVGTPILIVGSTVSLEKILQ